MAFTMAPSSPASSTASGLTITDKVIGKWCEVKQSFILQYHYDLTQQDEESCISLGIESIDNTFFGGKSR
jgi:hypothetical protein